MAKEIRDRRSMREWQSQSRRFQSAEKSEMILTRSRRHVIYLLRGIDCMDYYLTVRQRNCGRYGYRYMAYATLHGIFMRHDGRSSGLRKEGVHVVLHENFLARKNLLVRHRDCERRRFVYGSGTTRPAGDNPAERLERGDTTMWYSRTQACALVRQFRD